MPSSASENQNAAGGPQWEISGRLLTVRLPDGSSFTPPAGDIYRVAVEHTHIPLLPGPEISPPALSFSRYPLRPEIHIVPQDGAQATPVCCELVAVGDGLSAPLQGTGENAPEHLIADGTWYPLVPGGLDEIRKLLRGAGVDGPGPITLRQYLELKRLGSQNPALVDRSQDAAGAIRNVAPADFVAPAGFQGSLFPYQKNGLRWLELIASQGLGGILADEMGLGKTVQVIALLAGESRDGRRPSVVIAPGTVLENWRREIVRFAPSLRVLIHRGADRSGFPDDLRTFDVVVTSYDTLVRDLSLFRQINWNLAILDEAQAIKNPATRRASAAKRVPRRVGLAVSGTPVENTLRDLWSITEFAIPGFLGDQAAFERTFGNDADGAASVEPLVSPILLRRRVKDVAADLPQRIDIPQALELEAAQANSYERIRNEVLAEYGARATLVALTRLRMFCAHPWLVEMGAGDPLIDSPKYRRLVELLEEIAANGEKALVFTSFNLMTDIITGDIPGRLGIPVSFIDGRVPVERRQQTVDSFSGVEGTSAIVLNPRAAGTGLNIVAANHVIHYNFEWNPAVEDQASARAHRRGQTRPVTVHRLFYADTVEEIMDDRLTFKRQLADTAVVGTDGSDADAADILRALRKSPSRRSDSR
ncbi:MAG: DEAD/DEAH box helicase [Hyphomicrobiaceae bacterium]